MKYGQSMRRECVTVNADGTYTVKGGGWFWCRIKRTEQGLAVVETAPGMREKKACRLFLSEAKITVEKHFPA
jgi:hypothetical protein